MMDKLYKVFSSCIGANNSEEGSNSADTFITVTKIRSECCTKVDDKDAVDGDVKHWCCCCWLVVKYGPEEKPRRGEGVE